MMAYIIYLVSCEDEVKEHQRFFCYSLYHLCSLFLPANVNIHILISQFLSKTLIPKYFRIILSTLPSGPFCPGTPALLEFHLGLEVPSLPKDNKQVVGPQLGRQSHGKQHVDAFISDILNCIHL